MNDDHKFRLWDEHNKKFLDSKIFNIRCDTGELRRNGSIGKIGVF